MVINLQGLRHYSENMNNQDFFVEKENMKLVLDGCSSAKFSELGTRLFCQLFLTNNECNNVDKFEENVEKTFEKLIEQLRVWYPEQENLEDFIFNNLLFTILGCFKTEDEYIVKAFGDGFIVTQNILDQISYIRLSYGRTPPYYAYKYCDIENKSIKEYKFKTFYFKRKIFKKVGVSTDGISPIAERNLKDFDNMIIKNAKDAACEMLIKTERGLFQDDVTIAIFDEDGGK